SPNSVAYWRLNSGTLSRPKPARSLAMFRSITSPFSGSTERDVGTRAKRERSVAGPTPNIMIAVPNNQTCPRSQLVGHGSVPFPSFHGKGEAMLRLVFTLLAGAAWVLSAVPVWAELPTLIPRKLLFGNPTKASPQISPDGKQLAFLAPDDKNVLQVW